MRANSTIWRRKAGGYGGLDFGIVDTSSPKGQVSTKSGQLHNIASCDVETVRKGNERVIRPRLSDAAYFFDTDRRRTLESRLDGLEDVVFQHKLGTLHAKAQRVSALAVATAQDRPGALAEPDHALRIEKNMWASCASSHWSRKPGAIAIGRSRASSSLTACPPPRRSATAAPFTWIPRIASGAVPNSRPERPESIPPAVRGEMRADFPVAGLDAGPNPPMIVADAIGRQHGNQRRRRVFSFCSISGSSGCFPRPVCGTLTVCATMRGRYHNRPIRFFNTEGPVRPDMESARLRGHLTLWGGGIHHAKNQDRRYPRCSHEICRQLP